MLLAIRGYHQITFPAAAIEELKSRYELETVKKNIARKRTIDGYIDTAIQSLNQKTCSLTQERMNELCEQDIEDGLRSVIRPIIELPNYILDYSGSDFTVGAYLTYSSVPSAVDRDWPALDWIEDIFVLRDDLGLGMFFTQDLMYDQEASGTRFDLRNALQWTANHNKFFTSTFSHEGSE